MANYPKILRISIWRVNCFDKVIFNSQRHATIFAFQCYSNVNKLKRLSIFTGVNYDSIHMVWKQSSCSAEAATAKIKHKEIQYSPGKLTCSGEKKNWLSHPRIYQSKVWISQRFKIEDQHTHGTEKLTSFKIY